MKNIFFGVIVGVVLGFPLSAFAWSGNQVAPVIKGVECGSYNNEITSCGASVSKFRDGSIVCYVAAETGHSGGGNNPSISCLQDKGNL